MQKKNVYYTFLDGMRGIAILWVVLHHMPIPLPPWLEAVRIKGDLGVEFFFAISGFVVVQSLFSSANLRQFYLKRIFRIFPPYFLTLLFILILSFLDSSLHAKLLSIKDIWLSFPLFFYNYAYRSTTGQIPGSLNVFWSLCFEEQFYLILGFCAFFSRNRLKSILITLACLVFLLRNFLCLSGNIQDFEFLQLTTHLRLDAILLGCIAFQYRQVWLEKLKLSQGFLWVGLLVVLSALHRQCGIQLQGLIYGGFSISVVALILSLLENENCIRAFLQNRFLVWTGVCSYEIYLIHEIVLGGLVRAALNSWVYLFAGIILSLFGGYGFHVLLSLPLNRYLRKKFIEVRSTEAG
jgi:peptidoglycan/LPS O-acetylase OafA/YrhL